MESHAESVKGIVPEIRGETESLVAADFLQGGMEHRGMGTCRLRRLVIERYWIWSEGP